MRAAIYTWAAARTGGVPVIWSEQDAPRPSKPYVALRLLSPIAQIGQATESNVRAIQVIDALDATDYVVEIDDIAYLFTSPISGTTATIVRDGLIAVINTSLPGTAVALTSDAFTLAVALTADVDVVDLALLGVKIAQSVVSQGELVIDVDAYGDDDTATAILADTLKVSLETNTAQEAFKVAGIAFVRTLGSRRLPLVVNGLWEHRVGFDARFRALTRSLELLDLIEQIGVGGISGSLSV